MAQRIESADGKNTLKCRVQTITPFLDFSFRYEIPFVLECPISQFEGKKTTLSTAVRVEAPNGSRTDLGQSFTLPAIGPEQLGRVDLHHIRSQLTFSGVFAAGEGEYEIELFAFDDRSRMLRKKWKAKAEPHGREAHAAVALKPGTVTAISIPPWNGTSDGGAGLHLRVLLDAAPINPYARTLRAWDRAFLMGSLSSLLRGLPLASVQLVAFNLDQQREIFRDEEFDRTGFYRLGQALAKLELGTVSYKILAQPLGWAEMLTRLAAPEKGETRAPDAVVFIGPTNRIDQKAPDYLLEQRTKQAAPLFYFEYFPLRGREFPDAIQHLTKYHDGTTYKLYSPGDLALAIARMQSELRDTGGGSARRATQ